MPDDKEELILEEEFHAPTIPCAVGTAVEIPIALDEILDEGHELIRAKLDANRYAAAVQALATYVGFENKRPTPEEATEISRKTVELLDRLLADPRNNRFK